MKSQISSAKSTLIASIILVSAAALAACNDDSSSNSGNSACGPNAIPCNDQCVNHKVDPQNCGLCGNICDSTEACVDGTCKPADSVCPNANQRFCNGNCVDILTNPNYCGNCNTKCQDNESCQAGSCVVGCAKDYSLCDGTCYNLLRDAEHCGDCHTACSDNMYCAGGDCKCQSGYFDCDENPANGCESTQACTHAPACASQDLVCGDNCCTAQQTCCGTFCSDLQTDPMHCGSCTAEPCRSDQSCVNGSCQDVVLECEGNDQPCFGACVDTFSDIKNCGTCGNTCGKRQTCNSGWCEDIDPSDLCTAPEIMCYGMCVNITNDDKHCGKCLNACGESQKCVNSICELQCGELTNCNGACYNLDTSNNHCGDCTTACKDGQTCNGGTCACAPGRWDCDGIADNGCESTQQCTCTKGQTQACWRGATENRNKGVCRDGIQTCDDSGQFWGPCTGGVYPYPITCDERGLPYTDDHNCNGISDDQEECVTQCDLMLSDSSYIGCEYWAAYTQNRSTSGNFAAIISNMGEEDATVYVYFGSNDNEIESSPIVVQKGTVKTIILSESNQNEAMLIGTTKRSVGFRLVSTRPVTAYQFNPLRIGAVWNDALLLLPKNVYGKRYFNIIGGSASTYMAIQATSPGETKVYIKPNIETWSNNDIDIPSFPTNRFTEQTLHQFEVLQFTASDSLTGTEVTADKPFVAIGGCESCYNARMMSLDVYDHYSEQLFPYQSWGNEFAIAGFKKQGNERDQWRILAAEDGTELTITPQIRNLQSNSETYYQYIGGNNSSAIPLNKGQYYDIVTVDNFHLKSNKPILVAGFIGDEIDWDTNHNAKDSSYTLVVPIQQFRSDYSFMIPADYNENYITIIAPNTISSVIITETESETSSPINLNKSNFTAISGTDYMYRIQNMGKEHKAYKLIADKPVGVQSYGYYNQTSYAYPLGLNLIKLNVSN